MNEPCRLQCRCGTIFIAGWVRRWLDGIQLTRAMAPCPGCGNTHRIVRTEHDKGGIKSTAAGA